MESPTKGRAIDIIALLCALWFLLTSWIWIYYVNTVISFPIGLIAFWFWNSGKQERRGDAVRKITSIVLILGALVSVGALIVLLLNN
jgi:hypothetical protein